MGDKTNRDKLRREQALEYHAGGRPGKIEVVPTKEAKTQKDLSLAYSPGVAIPCTEIKNNPADGSINYLTEYEIDNYKEAKKEFDDNVMQYVELSNKQLNSKFSADLENKKKQKEIRT